MLPTSYCTTDFHTCINGRFVAIKIPDESVDNDNIIDAINIVITINSINNNRDNAVILVLPAITFETDHVIMTIDTINSITIDLIDTNRDDAMIIMYGTNLGVITIDLIDNNPGDAVTIRNNFDHITIVAINSIVIDSINNNPDEAFIIILVSITIDATDIITIKAIGNNFDGICLSWMTLTLYHYC